MHPKINPDVEIGLKENAFFYRIGKKGERLPIDPLAAFICSLCDGKHTEEDIANGLKEKLDRFSFKVPENISMTEEIKRIVDTLSTKGIVFLEE